MSRSSRVPTSGNASQSQAELAFRQLCHVLSLSRTGKVQSAIDNLVLTTLNLDPKVGDGGDPEEVAEAVSTYFGVSLDVDDVRTAIEDHLGAGRLQIDRTTEPSRIVLGAAARAEVAKRIEGSSQLEDDVRREWVDAARAVAPSLKPDALWAVLQNYLGQVFRQHGAEAVQLLDSRSDAGTDKGNLQALLDRAIDATALSGSREEARAAIRGFFRNPGADRLRYMSELLDGTFTFFALTVSDSTAEYLKGQIPSLRLFLDTNVLLAVLGMQDNPLQEADVELLDIIKAERYPFKLYYHERTFKEILDILDAASNSLKKRHFTPALSRAYLQYADARGGGGFGLERRFHAQNAEREVDVEAFLARFNHVEELLKDRGIQRYNQSGADLDIEAKGAHIAEFQHFLDARARPGRPPRRYEALDHDVTVWMYLQRQRVQTTNALRSGALLLSNDYSLHTFDRSYLMSAADGKRVATVVLPHHLLQILRPFSQVTENYDERFMEIFAAPEFRTTQTDYGATVSKVLAYLSSFEGVPTETAVHILNDDLLMGRLKDVETTDAEFGEAIESAVLKQNSSLVKDLSEMSGTLSAAEQAAKRAQVRADEEKNAREEFERIACVAELASAEAVQRAMAELAETQEREAAESLARKRAAVEQSRLLRELDDERRLRASAEGTLSEARARSKLVRMVLAAVVGAIALGLVMWGPGWANWQAFETHPRRVGIQVLVGLAVAGVAYVGGGGKHRATAFTGIVVAALIGVASLL